MLRVTTRWQKDGRDWVAVECESAVRIYSRVRTGHPFDHLMGADWRPEDGGDAPAVGVGREISAQWIRGYPG
jgi:hypothetical protein